MAQTQAVPVFDPSGQVRMIPPDQEQAALRAGGKRAVKMTDPKGTPRWVRESDVPTAIASGGRRVDTGAAPNSGPKSISEKLLGKYPIRDSLGNVAEHAKNFVAGPLHAFADPATPQEKQDIEKGGGVADPIDIGLYRMTAEPTVNAFREAYRQWKAKNYVGEHGNEYDDKGNYKPSVASSLVDALPVVGSLARSIENDAHSKGAVPALLGGATDLAMPYAASKVLRAPRRIARAAQEVIAPTKTLDAPLPNDTVSARQRFLDAQNQGVNLDAAQATNAKIPAMAKKVTEQSLLGGPKFEENNASNVAALHDHTAAIQDSIAPSMSREDFGNMVKQRLIQHKLLLEKQAGHGDLAKAILDDMTPNDMSREDFGNFAKQKLLEHQQELMGKSADIFDELTKRVGTKQPNSTKVRGLAQGIIDENKEYYQKHPELLKGGTAQAWSIVNDLAGGKPVLDASGRPMIDTWSDMHRLRSDLMDQYRSPDIVGSRAEGWLKQLTGSVDNAMTGASSGLKPGERAQFRQANDIYRQMKDAYDNPTSKLYHVVRAPDGMTAANMLNDVTPAVARQIHVASADIAAPELSSQLERQTVSRLLDPTESGSPDLGGFGGRFNKVQKEKLAAVVRDSVHRDALQDLAEKTSQSGPYDQPGTALHKVLNAPDGSSAAEALAKPSPETVRQVHTAADDIGDKDLVPQLQRQTVSRLVNPADSDLPDLKNLPARFGRAQKEQLSGVLTPEQMEDVEKLARTAKVVNFDANPSGTAKTLQPATEAGTVGAGAMGIVGGAVSGSPAVMAASAVPLATTVARGAVAGKLVDAGSIGKLMAPRPPIRGGGVSPVAAIQEAGAVQADASDKSDPDAQVDLGTSQGNPGTPPPDKPGMTPLPTSNATPPAGATHEVLSPDGKAVIGHVVDGTYVPLNASGPAGGSS